MRQIIIGLTVALISVIGMFAPFITIASAAESLPPNFYGGCYTSNNIFAPKYYGQCTWYAYGRALEVRGVALTPCTGPASAWYEEADKAAGYTCTTTPRANSIACWSGHVAYVESVSGDQVTISQANQRNNLGTMNFKQGIANYNGTNTLSAYALANNRDFQGYIYVDGYDSSLASSPTGVIDECTGGEGTISVRGWVVDRDVPSQSIGVHVYIGGGSGAAGAEGHAITADKARPDVNGTYEISGNHGFSDTIATGKRGEQEVYLYAINVGDGRNVLFGTKTVTITGDAEIIAPTISNVRITDLSRTGYTISCTVTDNIAVSHVDFPTWTDKNGQDDVIWHRGTINGNTASCRINVSEHNNEYGTYITRVFAYDSSGNSATTEGYRTNVIDDKTAPTISNVRITDLSRTGYTISCTVTDNVAVSHVDFPVWTRYNGQDDVVWHRGTINGNTASCRINVSEHNNEYGTYITRVFAYDSSGNSATTEGYHTDVVDDKTAPTISNVIITDLSNTGYTISCTVSDNVAISRVEFPAWTRYNGQDDVVWHRGTINGNTASCRINVSEHNNEYGTYITRVFAYDSSGNSATTEGYHTDITDGYIPAAAITYNNHDYSIYNYSMPWNSAKTFCQQMGGHLATITSREEHEAVQDLIAQGNLSSYWLGATDEKTEGIWEWITNEDWSYAPWTSGEPNNGQGAFEEDYLKYHKSSNLWLDSQLTPTTPCGFICEFEQPHTDTSILKMNNEYLLSVKLNNCVSPCIIIVAGYKENKFVNFEIRDYSKNTEEFTMQGDFDTIKVMLLDDISTLKPLSDAEIIPSSEWIIEQSTK